MNKRFVVAGSVGFTNVIPDTERVALVNFLSHF
jgi:hypothetical protein